MPRYQNGVLAHGKTLAWRAAMPLVIVCALPATAAAQTLTGPVARSSWATSNVPSYISMYEYIPTKLANPPPVLVAAHYCGGSASALFGDGDSSLGGMPKVEQLASQYGVIMIFPQTANDCNGASGCSVDCWDVGSSASLTHGGDGDTEAIAEMIQYEITTRGANPNRVYVMGVSSGAFMVQALAAVYPEVFQAGAEFSGVPAGCWSDGWSASSNWSNTCAMGNDTMSAAAWGALAKSMYPGYSGPRPRLQLYHGTSDTIVNYADMTEAILQWTNVLLGLTPTPSSLTNPTPASIDATSSDTTSDPGYTIDSWADPACNNFTVLQAITQAGGGHTTPIDPTRMMEFFGLNNPTGPDPGVAACGDAGTSSGGSSGSGSSSGGSASGASGGSTGGSGTASSAGAGGTSTGGTSGSSTGGGGTSTTGGSGGNGGSGAASSNPGSSGSNDGTGGSGSGGSGGSGGNNIAGGCNVAMGGGGATGAGALAAAGLLGIALSGRRRRRA